jgi:hypothetical protein
MTLFVSCYCNWRKDVINLSNVRSTNVKLKVPLFFPVNTRPTSNLARAGLLSVHKAMHDEIIMPVPRFDAYLTLPEGIGMMKDRCPRVNIELSANEYHRPVFQILKLTKVSMLLFLPLDGHSNQSEQLSLNSRSYICSSVTRLRMILLKHHSLHCVRINRLSVIPFSKNISE